jgi:hypothetical protein
MLFENDSFIAIQFKGIYIVRIYSNNDSQGTFRIRYWERDFGRNPLMDKATLSNKKLRNYINNTDDLQLAKQMLTTKSK